VIASVLAVALGAASWAKAEETAGPTAFNSRVAFDVYAVIGEEPQLVGSGFLLTTGEQDGESVPCKTCAACLGET
jgi:hypothetical protein